MINTKILAEVPCQCGRIIRRYGESANTDHSDYGRLTTVALEAISKDPFEDQSIVSAVRELMALRQRLIATVQPLTDVDILQLEAMPGTSVSLYHSLEAKFHELARDYRELRAAYEKITIP